MDDLAALDELNRLLDADGTGAAGSSVRSSAPLRAAAALAVEHLGADPSTPTLAAAALRRSLDAIAMETALRIHDREHPDARPSLAEIAHALAVQDGSPLGERPDLLAAAASAVLARRPEADADDVLLWAQARLEAPG